MTLSPNDRSIAGFTMTGHALVHWFETSIPIFLVVWLAEFDTSVGLFGLVIAAGYAPFGLGALPAGVLADRFGPKRLVLVCLGGMSAAFGVLALANSIVAIAAGLICWGIAASIYHPAGLSLISTGVEERGRVFAWHGIAGNVGIALGPFVAATLLIVLEWHLVAALLALPGLVAVAYGLGAEFDPTAAVADADDSGAADANLDGDGSDDDGVAAADSGNAGAGESTDEALSLSDLVSNTRALFASAFAVVFVLVTFEGLFYRGMLTYLPEILHGAPAMGRVELGAGLEGIEPSHYIYVGLLVVGMAGQYVGGRLTDRLRPERGLLAIFLVLATLAVAFVVATTAGPTTAGLAAIVGLSAVFGFFLFAIQPFYQEAVAVYTPPEARGLSYGYTYLGEFGLGAASIAIGGVVLGISRTGFFLTMAAFALVGVALAVVLGVGLDRFADWGPGAETAGSDD